jgi:hypothetical protein
MKNTVWPFAVIGLLLIVGGCAGTSTGFGVYGSPGYYPGPYYDSFWGEPLSSLLLSIITRIHSALRSGPSPIRGRSTILGHIPIPIDLLLIATDGLAPDAITADRQIGRRKTSLAGVLGVA